MRPLTSQVARRGPRRKSAPAKPKAQGRKLALGKDGASGKEPLFPLRELPRFEALEALAKRFPELDPSAAEAYLVLLRVSTDILESMEVHLGRHGLSRGRFGILMMLLRAEGEGVSPSMMARSSGVTRATITGLVDGLERDDLVRREHTERDRRSYVVRLTPKGEKFMRDLLPHHLRRVARLMKKLSREERGTLVELLMRVNDALPLIRNP